MQKQEDLGLLHTLCRVARLQQTNIHLWNEFTNHRACCITYVEQHLTSTQRVCGPHRFSPSCARRPILGLPEVPTLDETVLKGFNADTWVGLFAPARTPEPIVRRLSDVTKVALADPDVRRKLVAGGNNIVGNDTAAFRLFLDAESKKWGEVVRAGNIKLDE